MNGFSSFLQYNYVALSWSQCTDNMDGSNERKDIEGETKSDKDVVERHLEKETELMWIS